MKGCAGAPFSRTPRSVQHIPKASCGLPGLLHKLCVSVETSMKVFKHPWELPFEEGLRPPDIYIFGSALRATNRLTSSLYLVHVLVVGMVPLWSGRCTGWDPGVIAPMEAPLLASVKVSIISTEASLASVEASITSTEALIETSIDFHRKTQECRRPGLPHHALPVPHQFPP